MSHNAIFRAQNGISSGGGSVTFGTGAANTAGGSSGTVSTPAFSVSANQGVAVWVSSANGTVSSVAGGPVGSQTDVFSSGGTAISVASVGGGQGWYICSATANANYVVTATLSSSQAFTNIIAIPIIGAHSSGCLDSSTPAGNTTTASDHITSNSFTPTVSGAGVFCAGSANVVGTITISGTGGSYTAGPADTTNGAYSGTLGNGGTSAQTCTATKAASSVNWLLFPMVFKP